MSLKTRISVRVDVRPLVEEHLLLPLAEVRGADPDRVVDARCRRAPAVPRSTNGSWLVHAPRLSPKSTNLGRRSSGKRGKPIMDRVEQHPGLSLDPSSTRSSDSTDGRAAYCIADGGAVAASEKLERRHRRVVDVAGAGRGRDQQPRTVERTGALQLVDDRAPLSHLRPDHSRGRRRRGSAGRRVLTKDLADLLRRGHGPHEPTALLERASRTGRDSPSCPTPTGSAAGCRTPPRPTSPCARCRRRRAR